MYFFAYFIVEGLGVHFSLFPVAFFWGGGYFVSWLSGFLRFGSVGIKRTELTEVGLEILRPGSESLLIISLRPVVTSLHA